MVNKSGFGLFMEEATIFQANSSILLLVAIIDTHTHTPREASFSIFKVREPLFSLNCALLSISVLTTSTNGLKERNYLQSNILATAPI